MDRAYHQELLDQVMQQSSQGCQYCSNSIDWDYFDSDHFDQELLDGGQLKWFIQ